jgi:hypothetical protein
MTQNLTIRCFHLCADMLIKDLAWIHLSFEFDLAFEL